MSNEIIEATLDCAQCQQESIHELRYAGRLLVSTTCTVCKTQVKHESNDLRIHYAKDLQHRIATKPWRLWKRFWRAPRAVFWSFPKKVIGQPFKIWREFRNIGR
ncbi:MAG: hypothetical protein WCO08_04785 [Actinomycetes bacterium]